MLVTFDFDPKLFQKLSVLLAVFTGIYLVELVSLPLSIDEEYAATGGTLGLWIPQGRWAMYLFERFVLPQPIIPFLTPAIFGIGCAVAYLLVLDAIGLQRFGWQEIASFAIFCGYPTWFLIVEFYSNIAATGVAFALAALAVWIAARVADTDLEKGIRRISIARLGLASMCGAIAIGVYQSFALSLATLCVSIWVLQRYLGRGGNPLREAVTFAIVVVGSTALYVLITFLTGLFEQRRSAHISGFFKPMELLRDPLTVLNGMLKEFGGALGFEFGAFALPLWAIPIMLVLGLLAIGGMARSDKSWGRITVLCAMVALVIPFALHLVTGGFVPKRALVALPVAVWLFAYAAISCEIAVIRRLSCVALGVAVFQIATIQNTSQAAHRFAQEYDRVLAGQIQERLANLPGFEREKTYGLIVSGALEFNLLYRKMPQSTSGRSFFGWDQGRADRITRYMQIVGYDNLVLADRLQARRVNDRVQKLPIWPMPGSLVIDGDVVLLRLGEKPTRK